MEKPKGESPDSLPGFIARVESYCAFRGIGVTSNQALRAATQWVAGSPMTMRTA